MRENVLTSDLSISGNFKQLCFFGRKVPPPPQNEGKLFWHQIYPIQAILSNFGCCGRKAPPPRMRENFLAQIYPFQQFQANFPSSQEVLFCHKNQSCSKLSEIIHFTNFWATLVFEAEKPPPLQDEGKFFGTRSIHFRKFWATLVCVAEKPPPPRMREIFLTPDLSISGNFEQLCFLCHKSPPPQQLLEIVLTPDLFISRNFWATLVFVAEKPRPPHFQDEGKFFDTRSIHFRQFRATLVFVAEKHPLPPRMREIFLTPDLSNSGNFEQLWFLWQKSPPPPTPRMRENFWHQIYPFQAILSNFGFVAE